MIYLAAYYVVLSTVMLGWGVYRDVVMMKRNEAIDNALRAAKAGNEAAEYWEKAYHELVLKNARGKR